MSSESSASSIDGNEIDREKSVAQFHSKFENSIPAEDFAADCFARLFDEQFDPTERKLAMIGSPLVQRRQHQVVVLGSTGHVIPKQRHKSPSSSRPQSLYQQISKDGDSSPFDSVRKSRSTALPAITNTNWTRNGTASSPEFKVDDRGTTTDPIPLDTRGGYSRRVHVVRTTCYYNFRLVYAILNCFILITGLVYTIAGIGLSVNKELMLVVVEEKVFAWAVVCIFGVASLLLIFASSGLSCATRGPKKTAALAGCSLLMATIVVALAFLQSTNQPDIESDAELIMFRSIQRALSEAPEYIWDYIHETFKCCGVRSYLDWCEKVDETPKLDPTAGHFIGSFTCNLPQSCCLRPKIRFGVLKSINTTSCVVAPTPFNTHRNGCLIPILIVISYMGKVYRVTNFVTAVILLIVTAASMIIFTHL